MADWKPQTFSAEPDTSEDWQPTTLRIPVKAHSRRARNPIADMPIISGPARILGSTPEQVAGNLPMAGGIAGSFVGGVPGATIGGGLATAAKIALQAALGDPTPENWKAFRQELERGALIQGGGAAVGTGLGKGLQLAGRTVMRAALLPGKSLAGFPDVAKTALEKWIPAGKGFGKLGLGGAVVSDAARQEAAIAEDAVLAQAGAKGTKFTADDLAQEAIKRASKNAGRRLTGAERFALTQKVNDEARGILAARTSGVVEPPTMVYEPWQVKIIKQDAQDAAKAFLDAKRAGTAAAGDPNLMSDIAQGAHRQLSTVRGWQQLAKQTQSLIGLNRAMSAREAPASMAGSVGYGMRAAAHGGLAGAGAATGAMLPGSPQQKAQHALEGLALGALMGSPEALSLLAFALHYPGALAGKVAPQIGAGMLSAHEAGAQ